MASPTRSPNTPPASGVGSGILYQGSLAPQYRGIFVFGEFVQGRLFAIDTRGRLSTAMQTYSIPMEYHGAVYASLNQSPVGEGSRSDFRIGQDSHGELYALLKGPGAIYRLVLPR